jgi:hypothetical protein
MKEAYVKTKDGWVNIKEVEVTDVSETFHGDEATFIYKGEMDWSLIVIGSRPGA